MGGEPSILVWRSHYENQQFGGTHVYALSKGAKHVDNL